MNTELMKTVETVVRPVHASLSHKLRMRGELYRQLEAIYEEEAAPPKDRDGALERARLRFGDPATLTRELQATIWRPAALVARIDHGLSDRRPGESEWRHAARVAVTMCALMFGLFVPLIAVGERHVGLAAFFPLLEVLLLIAVLYGINTFVMVLCGRRALAALHWEGKRLRIDDRGRAFSAAAVSGITLGLSQAALMRVAGFELPLAAYTQALAIVGLVGATMFALVMGQLSRQFQQLAPWHALELSGP